MAMSFAGEIPLFYTVPIVAPVNGARAERFAISLFYW